MGVRMVWYPPFRSSWNCLSRVEPTGYELLRGANLYSFQQRRMSFYAYYARDFNERGYGGILEREKIPDHAAPLGGAFGGSPR